ncbi:MAG: class I SAM-dependent methyltransferase [Patescibacteria group bacterium]
MKMFAKIMEYFFSKPVIYNFVRKPIAGDQREVKEFVLTNIKKFRAKSILDVGCGTGDYVPIVPLTVQYLGIDTNEQYLSYVKNHFKAKNRKFLLQDATKTKFYQDKKFDIVILISILHHLSDDELSIILPQIRKVAKKAIIFTDIVPDPGGWLPKLLVKLDRGQYVRSREEKLKLIKKHLKVNNVKMLDQKLATVCGVVCVAE